MLTAPGMRPFSNDSGSRTSITSTAFCSISALSSSIEIRGTLRIACAASEATAQPGAVDDNQRFCSELSHDSLNLFCSSVSVPPDFSTGTISMRGSSSSVERGVHRLAAAADESQRHAVARLVPRERLVVVRHRRQVGAVETHQLIVLRDAGLIERRFPRHEAADAQARCRRPASSPGRQTRGRRPACAAPGRRAPAAARSPPARGLRRTS